MVCEEQIPNRTCICVPSIFCLSPPEGHHIKVSNLCSPLFGIYFLLCLIGTTNVILFTGRHKLASQNSYHLFQRKPEVCLFRLVVAEDMSPHPLSSSGALSRDHPSSGSLRFSRGQHAPTLLTVCPMGQWIHF